MTRNRKRVAWAIIVLATVLSALVAWQAEYFSITIFERRWTQRLEAIHSPEEMPELFKRHEVGDYFVKRYPDGEWLIGVSASSCGNGLLPDLLLIRESNGTIHRIPDDHMCGRGGIQMAIPELASESYEAAVNAIVTRETLKRKK